MKTLRAFLLASCAAAVAVPTARAQLAVQDPINLIQNTITATTSVKSLAEAVQAVRELQRTYRLLDQTYNAIAHTTDVRSVARNLGGVSRWVLPPGSRVPDLLTAAGSGNWGRAASLLDGSRAYRTPEEDEYQREMDRRERITSNAQATVVALMEDMEVRTANLEILQDRLEEAKDGTEVSAVAGLIQVERENLQHHKAMLEGARIMLAADDRVTVQRQEQMWRRDVDEHIDRTRGALDGW